MKPRRIEALMIGNELLDGRVSDTNVLRLAKQLSEVGLAVALGLLIGKPLGITVFSFLAVRTGMAALPRGVNWGLARMKLS